VITRRDTNQKEGLRKNWAKHYQLLEVIILTVTNSNLKEQDLSESRALSALLVPRLAQRLKLESGKVSGAGGLLDEGATIPFVAR
jgi:hypothetical protein